MVGLIILFQFVLVYDKQLVHLDDGFVGLWPRLKAVCGRSVLSATLLTGPALVGLGAGPVIFFGIVARLLLARDVPEVSLSRRQFALITFAPMLVAPPRAVMLDPGFLPVLVADSLALHLANYGGPQLGLLIAWRVRFGTFTTFAYCLLLVGFGLFGFALDRYLSNIWPNADRLTPNSVDGIQPPARGQPFSPQADHGSR